jgi:predicted metal-dependent hydrolase
MTIGYLVQFSSRARRITIKIKPDRSVEVVAPMRVSREEIRHLMGSKADWICAQVASTKRAVAVRRTFCDGETYPFLGGTLTVRVTRGGSMATAVRNEAVLEVNLPSGMLPSIEQGTIKNAVAIAVKTETLRAAIPRVIHYASAFGVGAPQVNVRKNKGKWGFCTSSGNVTFASELCLLPPRLFDYVVAHEVCHLIVMDHSDRFWDAAKKVMPDCFDRRAELKRDSPLYRIFTD